MYYTYTIIVLIIELFFLANTVKFQWEIFGEKIVRNPTFSKNQTVYKEPRRERYMIDKYLVIYEYKNSYHITF